MLITALMWLKVSIGSLLLK